MVEGASIVERCWSDAGKIDTRKNDATTGCGGIFQILFDLGWPIAFEERMGQLSHWLCEGVGNAQVDG